MSLAQNNNFSDKNIVRKFKSLKSNLSLINIVYKPASDAGDLKSKASFNAGENWIKEKYESTIIDLNIKDVPYFIKQTWLLVKYYDFNFLPHFRSLNERILNFGINKSDFNSEKWINEVNSINDFKKELKKWSVPPEQLQASEEYFKRNYAQTIELYKIAIEKWQKELPPENPNDQENFYILKSTYIALSYSQSCECYFYLDKYDSFSNTLIELETFLSESSDHITATLGILINLRIMQGKILLWNNNDYESAISLANKLFTEVENFSSYPQAVHRSICQEFFYECYRYTGDISKATIAAENQKNHLIAFYPPETQYDNYREIAEATFACQIAIINNTGYKEAYYRLKMSAEAFETIYPNIYEHVKQYNQTLIPHSKTLEIDSEASTFLLKEKGEFINIVCKYKLPESKKRVMNFYNYKLTLEIFKQGDPDKIIHTETIKIDNPANPEPKNYTFGWDGFVDGEYIDYNVTANIKYFSTYLYSPTSGTPPVKKDDDENSSDKLIAEVEHTVFKSPVWIDENRSTKYFNVADKELCEFSLYYKVHKIDSQTPPAKFDLVLHIFNDEGDEVLTRSLDINETLFMWNGLNSYNEIVPWGKYHFFITIEDLSEFNQPESYDSDAVSVKLKSVSFNSDDAIAPRYMQSENDYFFTNQWPGDQKYGVFPVMFIKNHFLKAKPVLESPVLNTNFSEKVKIAGQTVLQVDGITKELTVFSDTIIEENESVLISSKNTMQLQKMPDKIEFFPNFIIKWFISLDNGKKWIKTGESKNPVYITYAKKNNEVMHFKPLHTLLHIGCTYGKNAYINNANASKIDIINAIFKAFESKNINSYPIGGKSKLLKYYKNWNFSLPLTIRPSEYSLCLLYLGDGDCSMWQYFFLDILYFQGLITNEQHRVRINSKVRNTVRAGICIKPWNKTGFQSVGMVQSFKDFFSKDFEKKYKYLNLTNDCDPIYDNKYMWLYNEIIKNDTSEAAVKGQGNTIPVAFFNFHDLVRIPISSTKIKYFDPSYGNSIIIDTKLSQKNMTFLSQYSSKYIGYIFLAPQNEKLLVKKDEVLGPWTHDKDFIETEGIFIFSDNYNPETDLFLNFHQYGRAN
jgi:hypothetical protein